MVPVEPSGGQVCKFLVICAHFKTVYLFLKCFLFG